jgi:hypothetical protein
MGVLLAHKAARCARRERQRDRATAQKRDELAPSHSITSTKFIIIINLQTAKALGIIMLRARSINVRFRGQSGHPPNITECPLLTHIGHRRHFLL